MSFENRVDRNLWLWVGEYFYWWIMIGEDSLAEKFKVWLISKQVWLKYSKFG